MLGKRMQWRMYERRIFGLRSKLDNAILETILRAEVNNQNAEKYGLGIRHIIFVFGGYKPKEKEKFNWLIPLHKELKQIGIIDKSFSRYSPQVIWNHLNKLKRMGALNRKSLGYAVVPEACYSFDFLRHLKHSIRVTKQEDCQSNGTVAILGISKFEKLGLKENEYQNWMKEFTDLTYELMKRAHKHRWEDFNIFLMLS